MLNSSEFTFSVVTANGTQGRDKHACCGPRFLFLNFTFCIDQRRVQMNSIAIVTDANYNLITPNWSRKNFISGQVESAVVHQKNVVF